jgi:hypothetical protein
MSMSAIPFYFMLQFFSKGSPLFFDLIFHHSLNEKGSFPSKSTSIQLHNMPADERLCAVALWSHQRETHKALDDLYLTVDMQKSVPSL